MVGTLSEVLSFVINNTCKQGYGNIKENSLFRLIPIQNLDAENLHQFSQTYTCIHAYVMYTSRYGLHSE